MVLYIDFDLAVEAMEALHMSGEGRATGVIYDAFLNGPASLSLPLARRIVLVLEDVDLEKYDRPKCRVPVVIN